MARKKGESGQSLVEFALVVPIFLLLVLGILEFAPVWENYEALNNATRAAARVMATCRFDAAGAATTAANTAFTADQPQGYSQGPPTIVVGSGGTSEECDSTAGDAAAGGDKITVTALLPVTVSILGVTFVSTTVTSRSVSTVE
jgi:Flp pilus assembly protein TadG